MSIVVVTNDHLKDKRTKTLEQEHSIAKEDLYNKWRKSDITKPNPILKLISLTTLPIVALWSLLLVGISFAMAIVIFLMSCCAKIFAKRY